MFPDGISFGIDKKTGKPYVNTFRGSVTFASTDEAAAFVADCVSAASRL
jgi:hypothetical protein